MQQWYQPHQERLHDDAPVRAAHLAQLVRIAEGYRSREWFLVGPTLVPPEANSAEAGPPPMDDDYLILLTVHSAKGQEWQTVCVLNVVDGCLPSELATGSSERIEEERRLLQAAMTRARQHLQLIVPQRFYVNAQCTGYRHVYGSLSRFVPRQVAELFDRRHPVEARAARMAPPASGPTIDLSARLRNRWS